MNALPLSSLLSNVRYALARVERVSMSLRPISGVYKRSCVPTCFEFLGNTSFLFFFSLFLWFSFDPYYIASIQLILVCLYFSINLSTIGGCIRMGVEWGVERVTMFTIDEQLLFLNVSLTRLPITYTNRATRTSIGSITCP